MSKYTLKGSNAKYWIATPAHEPEESSLFSLTVFILLEETGCGLRAIVTPFAKNSVTMSLELYHPAKGMFLDGHFSLVLCRVEWYACVGP